MSQSLLSISFYNIIEHTYCTLNEYRNVELRSSQRKTKKGFFFHGKKNPIYIQVLEHFWLSIKKNPLVKSNFKSPLNSLWLEKVVGMELSHIEKKYVARIFLWVWIFKKWRLFTTLTNSIFLEFWFPLLPFETMYVRLLKPIFFREIFTQLQSCEKYFST